MLDTNRLRTFQGLYNTLMVIFFGTVSTMFKEKVTLKTAKFLGGKNASELIHSLFNFKFLNPGRTKSIFSVHRSQIPWDC